MRKISDNDNKRNLVQVGVEHRLKQIEVNAGLRHTREEFNNESAGHR